MDFPQTFTENDLENIGSKALNAIKLSKVEPARNKDWITPKQLIISN
jgi:hypothetical protein